MNDIKHLIASFGELGYVVDEELATVVYLSLGLQKPLLLEGNPGVGKTETANILAKHLNTELIRLQCYEGLDSNAALYEWNYQRQLLAIKMIEGEKLSLHDKEEQVFSRDYLLERPLLKAISASDRSPVLLIDEIDRADEEFEAFLLELLSAYQISIPELGTIEARHKPIVILTSNRTRELSDALKRRCLYHWVNYPSKERELEIVQKHLPGIGNEIAAQVVNAVRYLRTIRLDKSPGVAETLDWAAGLMKIGAAELNAENVTTTLGLVLKTKGDVDKVVNEEMGAILEGQTAAQ